MFERNELIIPQKTVNQEEFKNPKTVSPKESKKEIMLHKNKETHPNQPQEKGKKQLSRTRKKKPANKIF